MQRILKQHYLPHLISSNVFLLLLLLLFVGGEFLKLMTLSLTEMDLYVLFFFFFFFFFKKKHTLKHINSNRFSLL